MKIKNILWGIVAVILFILVFPFALLVGWAFIREPYEIDELKEIYTKCEKR